MADGQLAQVIPLTRPDPHHFGCPLCGCVWFQAIIVVNHDGITAARSHVALCNDCKQEIELPG